MTRPDIPYSVNAASHEKPTGTNRRPTGRRSNQTSTDGFFSGLNGFFFDFLAEQNPHRRLTSSATSVEQSKFKKFKVASSYTLLNYLFSLIAFFCFRGSIAKACFN
jgi:hypothetical protein